MIVSSAPAISSNPGKPTSSPKPVTGSAVAVGVGVIVPPPPAMACCVWVCDTGAGTGPGGGVGRGVDGVGGGVAAEGGRAAHDHLPQPPPTHHTRTAQKLAPILTGESHRANPWLALLPCGAGVRL